MMTLREIKRLWLRSLDVIGDIAIIELKPEFKDRKIEVAKKILEEVKYIKVVVEKKSPISGDYRIMDLEWLAGEKRFTTIHREYGCIFKLDISKVYFTPRLSTERMRIAEKVLAGETIVNMFAGIGTYSIVIARKAKNKPSKIYSIDINPEAHKYAIENIKLNKVEDIVIPLLGDAKEIIMEKLVEIADRVLMPYPELALKYLPYAIIALKETGGVIHAYDFIKYMKGENPKEKMKSRYEEELTKLGVEYEIIDVRRTGEVAPREYRMAIDIKINSKTGLRFLKS
ncbi:MAG: class I SAM-dependent methyltransferase family protein [Candidatus Methanomethylicia archaeon]